MNRLFPIPFLLRQLLIALLFLFSVAGFSNSIAAEKPTVNLSSGCIERYDPELDYFPEKVTLEYATGFSVAYFKHYKVVTVTTPWPNAQESFRASVQTPSPQPPPARGGGASNPLFRKTPSPLAGEGWGGGCERFCFRYVLVQCGAPVPEGFAGAQIISIPIQSIAILSTTHLPHLELLDALDRLVGISTFKNVYSPATRRKIAAGEVVEIGRGPSINLEVILDLAPDLITAVGHDQPQYNTHPLLLNAGVHVAINSEYVEQTLLGRSEWLKFTAAFLNKDGLAQRRFAEMAARYQSYAHQVRDLPAAQKPSVFGGYLHRDVWYVPGGQSYIAQLVADAGGIYRWADDTHQASVSLSFEAVFERAGAAEVWFTSGLDWLTRADLLAANERYGAFKAFRERRVYNHNARLNEHKADDYWETGIIEPDVLLADVIKILHPDRLPDHRLKYYRWLP